MSTVQELRSLEAQIAELTKRKDELEPKVKERVELFDKIVQTLDSRGISRREMALELCPELGRAAGKGATGAAGTRRARAVKEYKNPHSGEVVQTKGGNHKILKAWKAKWGNEEVEGWVQKQA